MTFWCHHSATRLAKALTPQLAISNRHPLTRASAQQTGPHADFLRGSRTSRDRSTAHSRRERCDRCGRELMDVMVTRAPRAARAPLRGGALLHL